MLRKVLEDYRDGFRWSRFKETYQIGLEEGLKQGEINGESRLGKLITSLINAGRSSDVELAAKDENAREKFYKEFNIE